MTSTVVTKAVAKGESPAVEHVVASLGMRCPVISRCARNVWVVDGNWNGSPRKLAIKLMPSRPKAGTLSELVAFHRRARHLNAEVQSGTPDILALDLDHNCIVMEYCAGEPLEDHLVRRRPSNENKSALIRRTGEILAAFHSIRREDFGAVSAPRRNGDYCLHLEELWKTDWLQRWLPREFRDPRGFFDRLVGDWRTRESDGMLPVDAQPKNILVQNDLVNLIDLDYSFGTPALGASMFLVGLDRLWFRRPFLPGLGRRIANWQIDFLNAYLQRSSHAARFLQDLQFFYPWSLASCCAQQLADRPKCGMIIGYFYARALTRFLRRLPTARDDSPRDLFSDRVRVARASNPSGNGRA